MELCHQIISPADYTKISQKTMRKTMIVRPESWAMRTQLVTILNSCEKFAVSPGRAMGESKKTCLVTEGLVSRCCCKTAATLPESQLKDQWIRFQSELNLLFALRPEQ